MGHRRVSQEWRRAHENFKALASVRFREHEFSADLPPKLYHFTDCESLIRILETKTLWATLANSLNDKSEMQYGLRLLRRLVENDELRARELQLDALDAALERQTWRVFVISFCARSDAALQWLHYGRSGSGVAVGFRSAALETSRYRLHPVLYDIGRQIAWLRDIVGSVDDALTVSLSRIPGDESRDLLAELAMDTLATQLWMASPRMKDPSFAEEDEWRLVAHFPAGAGVPSGVDLPGQTYFRAVAGRIVPFKKLEFNVLPVLEVVQGASAPMLQDQVALRVLLETTVGMDDEVRVVVSPVPVRP